MEILFSMHGCPCFRRFGASKSGLPTFSAVFPFFLLLLCKLQYRTDHAVEIVLAVRHEPRNRPFRMLLVLGKGHDEPPQGTHVAP